MKNDAEENKFLMIAGDPKTIMECDALQLDAILNVQLITEAAKAELGKLQALGTFDLTAESGRKALRAVVRPIKQTFSDYEKNVKIVKKMYSEIPKKVDAASKAVRDLAEPAFTKILAPLEELQAQEIQVIKWWKKEGIPHAKYELENGLQALQDAKPHPYSSQSEMDSFCEHKTAYIAEWEKCLNRIYLEEKTLREADEKRREEAEKLRLQADEQRKAQAAIDAEQRKLAQASRELEEKKKVYEQAQAGVNPAKPEPNAKAGDGLGAPPAINAERKKAMRAETLAAVRKLLEGAGGGHVDIPMLVCKAIHNEEIPHVRFAYGEAL